MAESPDVFAQLAEVSAASSLVDAAIAKAVGVSETAQIARTEVTLRRYVFADWRLRAESAARIAQRETLSGSGPFTQDDADRVSDAVDAEMAKWATDVSPRFVADIGRVYALGRTSGARRGTGADRTSVPYTTPDMTGSGASGTRVTKAAADDLAELTAGFDVVDAQALKAIEQQQLLWIGTHYDTSLNAHLNDTIKKLAIQEGQSRVRVGAAMRDTVRTTLLHVGGIPGGFSGSAEAYFQGLVANATTVARVDGQLGSFARLGIKRYEIINPDDERTCPVCGHLDRKVFEVSDGVSVMAGALAAKTPDAVRSAHPWLTPKQMLALSPTPGRAGGPKESKALADAKFALPPFHFRCRCSLDIDEESYVVPRAPSAPRIPRAPISPATPSPAPPTGLAGFKTESPTSDALSSQYDRWRKEIYEGPTRGADEKIAKRLGGNKVYEDWLKTKVPGYSSASAQTQQQHRATSVRMLINNWNATSGDRNARAILMQLAAQEEFGLTASTLAHVEPEFLAEVKRTMGSEIPAARVILRAMHTETQEWFKRKGIKEVFAFRGAGWAERGKAPDLRWGEGLHEAEVQMQPMSSFGGDINKCAQFMTGLGGGGSSQQAMFGATIPVERILSVPATGYGVATETEFVVLGAADKPDRMLAVAGDRSYANNVLHNPRRTMDRTRTRLDLFSSDKGAKPLPVKPKAKPK